MTNVSIRIRSNPPMGFDILLHEIRTDLPKKTLMAVRGAAHYGVMTVERILFHMLHDYRLRAYRAESR